MIANYGYKDGSGEYYVSIDTTPISALFARPVGLALRRVQRKCLNL